MTTSPQIASNSFEFPRNFTLVDLPGWDDIAKSFAVCESATKLAVSAGAIMVVSERRPATGKCL